MKSVDDMVRVDADHFLGFERKLVDFDIWVRLRQDIRWPVDRRIFDHVRSVVWIEIVEREL